MPYETPQFIGLQIRVPQSTIVSGCPKGNRVALDLLKTWCVAYSLFDSLAPPPTPGDDLNNFIWLISTKNRSTLGQLRWICERIGLLQFATIVLRNADGGWDVQHGPDLTDEVARFEHERLLAELNRIYGIHHGPKAGFIPTPKPNPERPRQ
jgi:hypothetical protein